MGIATRVYADENDSRLPSAEILPTMPVEAARPLARICDVLRPYLARGTGTNSPAVFKCPKDDLGLFTRQGSSYEWNFELNGRRIDETKQSNLRITTTTIVDGEVVEKLQTNKALLFPPETTPLLLDYDDFHPRPPKSPKNVVYMDGHVAALDLLPEMGLK